MVVFGLTQYRETGFCPPITAFISLTAGAEKPARVLAIWLAGEILYA
jgi:hypothetical protein